MLEKDSSSVAGRDCDVILVDIQKLEGRVKAAEITEDGRALLLAEIKRVKEDVEGEGALEKGLAKWAQRLVLAVTFVPMLFTFGESVLERARRPAMEPLHMDLRGQTAVVTGGCGALGLELGILLANSGAEVVLGCRDPDGLGIDRSIEAALTQSPPPSADGLAGGALDAEDEFGEAFGSSEGGGVGRGDEEPAVASGVERRGRLDTAARRLASLGLLADGGGKGGQVEVWDLDLASIASVQAFARRWEARGIEPPPAAPKSARGAKAAAAERHQEQRALDLLVHAAATKEGCVLTEDGLDQAVQVRGGEKRGGVVRGGGVCGLALSRFEVRSHARPRAARSNAVRVCCVPSRLPLSFSTATYTPFRIYPSCVARHLAR